MTNDSFKSFLIDSALLFLPLVILHDVIMSPVEKNLIRSEDIIAYISDYSFTFFIPMGFFLAVMINFIVKTTLLKKRGNRVWNPFEKADKKERIKWKIGFSLISICIFAVCSLIMCAGMLQRTVITDDYRLKSYNFIGQKSQELEAENVRFVKIYPEAQYSRYSGFEDIYTVAEIYINGDNCFVFTEYDFDSFEQLTEYKNTVQKHNIKVYVADSAYNEPDREDLSEEKIKLLDDFYLKYEILK